MLSDIPSAADHERRFYEQAAMWGRGLEEYQRRSAQDLLSVIPAPLRTLLDAGCGDGAVTHLLDEQYDVTGLDISTEALSHVRTKSVQGSIADMPFETGSFDIVTASDVVEHLPGDFYTRGRAECARVAKSCVAITVPYREHLEAVKTLCSDCGSRFHINHHQRSFDEATMISLLPAEWSCAALVYTGLEISRLEAVQLELRASLGINVEWDQAICPSCGSSKTHSGEEPDVLARINEIAEVLAPESLPEYPPRNEILGLYVPRSEAPTISDGTRLVAMNRGIRREIAAEFRDTEQGAVLTPKEPVSLQENERVALEVTLAGVPRLVFEPQRIEQGWVVPAWFSPAHLGGTRDDSIVRRSLLALAVERRTLRLENANAQGREAEAQAALSNASEQAARASQDRDAWKSRAEVAESRLEETTGLHQQEQQNVLAVQRELAGVLEARDQHLKKNAEHAEALEQQLSEARQNNADLSEQLEQKAVISKEEIARLSEQITVLQREADETARTRAAAEEQAQEQSVTIEKLQQELAATQLNRDEAAARTERLVEEAEKLRKDLETRRERAVQSREDLASLQAALERERADSTRLENEADRLRSELQIASEELAQHKTQNREHQASLAAADLRLESITQDRDGLRQARENLTAELQQRSARVTELERSSAFMHRLATDRGFRWRVRLKSIGRGTYEPKAELQHRLQAQTFPEVAHPWTPSGRSFLMLCHDQRIDRRIVHQAHALLGAGWEGLIIAMSFDADDHLDTEAGVPVHRIGLNKLIPDCKSYWAYQDRQRLINWLGISQASMSQLNHRLYRLALKARYRGKTIGHPMPFDLAYIAAGKQYRADLVVAHDLPALRAAVTLAEPTGAKTMYDSHELYPDQRGFSSAQKRMLVAAEKMYAPKIDQVTTVSRSFGKIIQRRTGIKSFEVIRNVTHRRTPRPERGRVFHERLNLEHDAQVVLFQGSIVPDQNMHTLVRGFVELDRPRTHLIFLGPGEPNTLSNLKQLAGSRLDKTVHFLDPVGQDVLLDHTSSAHFGVIPYLPYDLNCRYCMPNKLFEYIQAGLPVLASDLVELRGVIEGAGGGGLLAELKTPKQMSRALDDMFARDLDADRRTLLQAAKELCWEVEQNKYLEITDSLVPARNQA